MQMRENGFKLLSRLNHHNRCYRLFGVRRIVGNLHEIHIKEDCGRDAQKKENEKYAGRFFQFDSNPWIGFLGISMVLAFSRSGQPYAKRGEFVKTVVIRCQSAMLDFISVGGYSYLTK